MQEDTPSVEFRHARSANRLSRGLRVRLILYPVIVLIVAYFMSQSRKKALEEKQKHGETIPVIELDPTKPAQLVPADPMPDPAGGKENPGRKPTL